MNTYKLFRGDGDVLFSIYCFKIWKNVQFEEVAVSEKKKFQQNASKFDIFLEYENPKLHFPFFISYYFLFFPLMNALVYVDIDQGIL